MPALRPATRTRLNLARNISCSLEQDPKVLAVIATGSVARNRCFRNSDLDLTVITADQGIRRSVTSEKREGVTIDIEWLTQRRALLIVKGGKRDLQSLREASRLGLGLFLLDRDSFEANFRSLALNLLPDRAMIEQRMTALSVLLADATSKRSTLPEVRWELFRALVDNLAFVLLLMHPFRYQKPKWVMADLRDAGYHSLNRLMQKAYRVGSGSSGASRRSLELSRQFIETVGQSLKVPALESMLQRGFTRKYAAWSYICRTWEDAGSLFEEKAFVEAGFTAKFAVRMTFPFYLEKCGGIGRSTSPVSLLRAMGNGRLKKIYQQLFPVPANRPQLDQMVLQEILYWAGISWNLTQQAYGKRV